MKTPSNLYSRSIPVPNFVTIVLILLVIAAGCRTSPPFDDTAQQTVRVSSLPMPEEDPDGGELNLTVLMLVMPNGTVSEAHIRTGHLDEQWNRSVVDSLLTWRFSELPGGNPDGRWHQRKIRVQLEESLKLDLAIYRSDTPEIADSLYRILARINDFDTFFAANEPGDNEDYNVTIVRNQDISIYPFEIRRALRILQTSRPTRPMYQDGGFVIFYKIGDRFEGPTHRPPPAI
jgi:hypothetical protein